EVIRYVVSATSGRSASRRPRGARTLAPPANYWGARRVVVEELVEGARRSRAREGREHTCGSCERPPALAGSSESAVDEMRRARYSATCPVGSPRASTPPT